MISEIFGIDTGGECPPAKQPSLIDLWTVGDQWQSRQEGWELLASGNNGGKWAICSTGGKSDAEMEQYVAARARTSLRHWLAATLACEGLTREGTRR